MASQNIEELASIIKVNTTKIQSYLSSNGLPAPSFGVDGSTESPVPPYETELESARIAIIDATAKLHDLMLGPREYLHTFVHDELIGIQAIIRYKLASSFPIHDEVTFGHIASKCQLPETEVRRFLRLAMTQHIFHEPRKGYVVHTAASKLLAQDSELRDWLGAATDDLWQAAAQTLNAIERYPGSQEPEQTGFALAHQTKKSIYQFLSDNPERGRRFGSALGYFEKVPGYDFKYVVDGYDWKQFEKGTIVDVGGGQGILAMRIAEAFPDITCVVQDLADVVGEGQSRLPETLSKRVIFQPHDFLQEQPEKNADVYLFRWIFHNWSDKYCIQILRALTPALKRGARVVIADNVLPDPGVLPAFIEKRIRSMDLVMLEIQNSRERELDDWKELFRQADPRFKWMGATEPAGSRLWIMEVMWE